MKNALSQPLEASSERVRDWLAERLPRGEVDFLVYDSIHPCGCYHVFFPTPAAPSWGGATSTTPT
jgi:hypothetical protein